MTELILKSKRSLPEINQATCVLCGDCVSACPENALSMSPQSVIISAPENCTYCAECEGICPQHAITCAYEISWQEETK